MLLTNMIPTFRRLRWALLTTSTLAACSASPAPTVDGTTSDHDLTSTLQSGSVAGELPSPSSPGREHTPDVTGSCVTPTYHGIGYYSLLSTNDQALAFDYNGDGKQDLFLYRPGQGAAWVIRSSGDTFAPAYMNSPTSPGIGGYNMYSTSDTALALDYDGDGKQDLFLYRPGSGNAWVIRSNGDGSFPAVFASSNGIAGYDMLSASDRALVLDYNGDGKQDLFLYRPGAGAAWVARSNGDGSFTAVYASSKGIAGYDLLSASDRALAFDYNGDGKQDLFVYRPGAGTAWVLRSNGDGSFTPVSTSTVSSPGIGGYDMRSSSDQALAFDYNGDGKQDLFLYRPGGGAAWVLRSNGDGSFTPVSAGTASSQGIAGYNMLSSSDHALAFDYDGDGKKDLFLYRPGGGSAWVIRSNGDGSFTAVSPSSNGLAGYDMLAANDQALPFDYNGDHRQDLFLYRPGTGAAFVQRSNGDGTFATVHPIAPPVIHGAATPNAIELTWAASPGATTYNVYRGTSSGGECLYMASLPTTSFVDTAITTATRYYYVVTPVAPGVEESGLRSNEVVMATSNIPYAPEQTFSADVRQIDMSWDSVPYAVSYNLYRGTQSGQETLFASHIQLAFLDATVSSAPTCTPFYYQVTSVNALGAESGRSPEGIGHTWPPRAGTPTNVMAVAGLGQVTLSWSQVSGATSYLVGREPSFPTSSGTTTTSSPFVDKQVTNGTTYKYWVQAAEPQCGSSARPGYASNIVTATPTGLAGPSKIEIYNCESDTLQLWMVDSASPSSWVNVGPNVVSQASSDECTGERNGVPASPVIATLASGHTYLFVAIDQTLLFCDSAGPQDESCRRWEFEVNGDSRGPILPYPIY